MLEQVVSPSQVVYLFLFPCCRRAARIKGDPRVHDYGQIVLSIIKYGESLKSHRAREEKETADCGKLGGSCPTLLSTAFVSEDAA